MIEQLKNWARFILRPAVRHNSLHEARRRRAGAPAGPEASVSNVLVICQGNICRSPFAERVLAAEFPSWTLRSAGLDAGADHPAEPGAIRVARERGIDLGDHGATPLDEAQVEWADLIVGMEAHHSVELVRRHPRALTKVVVLGDFLTEGPFTIDDPWGRPDDFFRETFEKIERAARGLAEKASIDGAGGRDHDA